MRDRNLQILLVATIVVAVMIYYFTKKNSTNWWPYIAGRTPSWGGNESVILLMFSLLFLGVTVATYMCLRKNGQTQMAVTYVLYLAVVVLGLLTLYFLSDKQRKYTEALTLIALTLGATVVMAYRAYMMCGNDLYVLLPLAVSVGTAAYLVAWVNHVKKH
jgi:tryptophan-rich sensory protein